MRGIANMIKPLTIEQSAYAEKHHNLIYAFLHRHGYSVDEYYDTVVFGYLRAVQKYDEREELHCYSFSTIAFAAMRTEMSNHRRAMGRRVSRYDIVPFDDSTVDIHAPDVFDLVAA
jgi:RNA polymerase sigma-70 factor (ECF subfamily)